MTLVRTPELARRARISYRSADYWTRIGLLEPAVPAHGSGSIRLYPETEIAVARALGVLSALGLIEAQQLRDELIEHVREYGLRGQCGTGPVIIDLDRIALDPDLPRAAVG